jgi:hypothetical protein
VSGYLSCTTPLKSAIHGMCCYLILGSDEVGGTGSYERVMSRPGIRSEFGRGMLLDHWHGHCG